MKEETTARLTEILSRTEGDKAGQKFAAEHSVEMGFSQYFCEFLAFRNMVLAEVVKKSGINKNYVYQIVKYSLQGTTQGNGLTGGLPPVRFSM